MKCKPWITKKHRADRVKFSETMLNKTTGYWRTVIFTDEKKFRFDGPDGNAFYWADSAVDPRYFSRRQSGGGGIMLWGGFSARGTCTLACFEDKEDSAAYCEIIEKSILPFANDKHENG